MFWHCFAWQNSELLTSVTSCNKCLKALNQLSMPETSHSSCAMPPLLVLYFKYSRRHTIVLKLGIVLLLLLTYYKWILERWSVCSTDTQDISHCWIKSNFLWPLIFWNKWLSYYWMKLTKMPYFHHVFQFFFVYCLRFDWQS